MADGFDAAGQVAVVTGGGSASGRRSAGRSRNPGFAVLSWPISISMRRGELRSVSTRRIPPTRCGA